MRVVEEGVRVLEPGRGSLDVYQERVEGDDGLDGRLVLDIDRKIQINRERHQEMMIAE